MFAYEFTQNGLSYYSSEEDKTCEVIDCSSNLSSVVIPTTVTYWGTTYAVTSIGRYAFSGCFGLTSIEIPNSVTSIGYGAFSGCSGLTAIEIPNFVTNIGDGAFSGCTGLTAIEIPNFVTNIGDRAFSGCTGLTAVEIPNSVTYIGDYALSDCSNLNHLIIEDGEETLMIGSYLIENSPIETLHLGREINNYTIFNKGLKTLKALSFSNYVKTLAYGEFRGCTGLTSVEIPSSVTVIGGEVFAGCTGLTSVKIPNSVTEIGYRAFSGCTGLTSIEIPNSVTSIGGRAFSGCNSLTTVEIPNSVTSIESCAFSDCTGIRELIIKDGEKKLTLNGGTAFQNCYISTLYLGRTVNSLSGFNESSLESLTIGNLVKSIEDYTFSGCSSLTSVIIPNTVNSLGASCFQGCTALTQANINVNGSLGDYCFSECTALTQATLGAGVTGILGSCFRNCSSLTEITIPAAVDSIGNNAFEGCTSLANVTIADRDSVLALGYNDLRWDDEPMFADCPLNAVYIGGNISYPTEASRGYSPFYRNTSLETVTITDKETEISENEFYGCTNLKNVTLGDGIETIGSYAFSGCAALTDFTFGSSLKSIGEEAFSDCTAMTRLVSRTAEPPVCGPQALDDINKWTCKLYVPDASIDAYQSADQWKEFFFITTDIAHAVEDGGSPADRILSGRVQVFDLSGRQVKETRKASSIDEVLGGLTPGTYILRGSGAAMKVIHE